MVDRSETMPIRIIEAALPRFPMPHRSLSLAGGLIIMGRAQTVSAIVVVYNNEPAEIRSLGDVVRAGCAMLNMESELVVVINDGTRDDYGADRTLTPNTNMGFGRAVNLGVRSAAGQVVILLNPDIDLQPDQFAELVQAQHEYGGIVSPAMITPSGLPDVDAYVDWVSKLQRPFSRRTAHRLLSEPRPATIGNHVKLPGACLVLGKETAANLGPFDENFFLYAEDRELSWRARRGGVPLTLIPAIKVGHRSGSSGRSVPDLVYVSQQDGALRLAHLRWRTWGLRLVKMELLTVACLARLRNPGSSRLALTRAAVRRWRRSVQAPALTVDSIDAIILSGRR